jgi:hypothetical protein
VTIQTARSRKTASKLVASAGVLASAAAVAGLATFGTFTDSTTPISTEVSTGTVSIDLSQPGVTIPVSTSGFVPGDSMSRAIDLRNDGSTELGQVSLAVAATTPSALTTDTTNGLRLTVNSCSDPWVESGTAAAPTYTCTGGFDTLYAGRVVMDQALPALASLEPHQVDHLLLTISLPTKAGNTFQDLSSTLSLTFTGTQRGGTAR